MPGKNLLTALSFLLVAIAPLSSAAIAADSQTVPAKAAVSRSAAVQDLLDGYTDQVDVTIDGLARAGETIKVKRGSVVQINLTQTQGQSKLWWFAHLTPYDESFVILWGHEPARDQDGRLMPKAPGNATFTYVAETPGTWKLTFKHGPKSTDLDKQVDQLPDQTVEVNIEVD